MRLERRAEEPKNGAREGTGIRRNKRTRIAGATTTVANPTSAGGRCGAAAGSLLRRDDAGTSANLSTETNVRESDGSSRHRRELLPSLAGGKTQPRSGGH